MVWDGALVKDYGAHILKQVTLPLRLLPPSPFDKLSMMLCACVYTFLTLREVVLFLWVHYDKHVLNGAS